MANEAVISELLGEGGDPIQYTVASSATIPKGSLMEMEDERTAKVMTAADKQIAGIAAAEKNASDSETTLSVYTNGIFKMTCSGGNITFGDHVVSSTSGNQVAKYDTLDDEKGYVLGYALETAADGETFLVRVKK